MNKHKLTTLFNGLLFFTAIGIFTPVLASNSDEIILPIELTAQGMPVTSIQIQGNDIPLIFDNGASHSSIVLSKELTKKLNLKMTPTNKKSCFHSDDGKKTCLKVYTIPELKIGHMTIHDVPCQLMDKLWGGHYDEGFIWFEAAKNGVIGLDLLRQFNVLVDYKTSRAILMKLGEYPHQYDMKNWIKIPFSNKYGMTTIAKINGTDVTLVWDTGANNSIMSSTTKIPAEKKSCAYKENPSCQYFETTTFMVGNKQLPSTKFFIQKNEIPFDGFIGSSFFKEHQVFFDFKNNLLFVKP